MKMTDYTAITRIKVSISEEEVNQLLSRQWVLLDISHDAGKPVFVLGFPYPCDMDEYCADAVTIPEV